MGASATDKNPPFTQAVRGGDVKGPDGNWEPSCQRLSRSIRLVPLRKSFPLHLPGMNRSRCFRALLDSGTALKSMRLLPSTTPRSKRLPAQCLCFSTRFNQQALPLSPAILGPVREYWRLAFNQRQRYEPLRAASPALDRPACGAVRAGRCLPLSEAILPSPARWLVKAGES